MKRIILSATAVILAFSTIAMAEVIRFTGEVEKISGDQVVVKHKDTGKSITMTVKDPTIISKFTNKKIEVGDTVQVRYDDSTNIVSKLDKSGC